MLSNVGRTRRESEWLAGNSGSFSRGDAGTDVVGDVGDDVDGDVGDDDVAADGEEPEVLCFSKRREVTEHNEPDDG